MIKVGIIDTDSLFVNRLKDAFSKQYPGEFEIMYFPGIKKAQTAAQNVGLDILLLNDANMLSSNTIPKQCVTALLTENRAAAEESALPAVCKYQSVDEWRTELLSFCRREPALDLGGQSRAPAKLGKVCLFTSAGGGAGVSAAAAAYCVSLAKRGKSVIYLNFEALSSAGTFFEGHGQYNFDDVIYALRSKKYSLERILEQAIVTDSSGVDFIPACRLAADMFSVTGEEFVKICEAIAALGRYDLIVADIGFFASENQVLTFLNSEKVVFVTNGTDTVNAKTENLLSALPILCGIERDEADRKTLILYNKFEADTGRLIKDTGLGKLGGINRMNCKNGRQLIREMAPLFPFERLSETLNV